MELINFEILFNHGHCLLLTAGTNTNERLILSAGLDENNSTFSFQCTGKKKRRIIYSPKR